MSRNHEYVRLINSRRWRELRALKLHADPLCEECRRQGRLVPATEVHHIIPVETASSPDGMRSLMFQYANLRSLCHVCHAEAHRLLHSHSKASVKENNHRAAQRFREKYL